MSAGGEEHALLLSMIEGLQGYSDDDKLRIIRTVMTYFNLGTSTPMAATPKASPVVSEASQIRELSFGSRGMSFSDHDEMAPKEFLLVKEPRTDIERVVCLAYFLAHYRDQQHFKTVDISKLNTEAAQAKFSNAAYAVNNATQKGFLVPAGKGMKQVSAIGEQFVDALPDRDAAKSVIAKNSKKRSRKRSSSSKSKKSS